MTQRHCTWMSGPKDAAGLVPPLKWWLVLTRDVLTKGSRRPTSDFRPPVTCHNTPKFVSPLPPRGA